MTDTAPRAGTRSRENTRLRLIEAAAEVFAEVGLDAASVEAICERAGFTRGAFYSNFDSKDELFLALAAEVAGERVQAVKDRIADLEAQGIFSSAPVHTGDILEQVLDVNADDRLGVLLMSEIRIHALRDPKLAAAYLAQDAEMHRNVTQITEDIGRAKGLRFRVPAEDAARLLLTVWEAAAVRAVMSGLDDASLRRSTSEALARAAQLLIDPTER